MYNNDMEEIIFVTVDEAAKILKVNKRHITRMIKAGELQAKDVSIGQHQRKIYRVQYSDLLKLQNGLSG